MLGKVSAAVFERWRTAVLFALMTKAESVSETLFKVRVLELLLSSPQLRSGGLGRDAILLLVEDDAGLIPRSHVWDLIVSLPILEESDDVYRLRPQISLTDFRSDGEPRLGRALEHVTWSLEEVTAAFFPVSVVAWTVRDARSAIFAGYRWFLWTLGEGEVAGARFDILPAFWKCGRLGDTPLGGLRAVTSIGDTLGALLDSYLYPCSISAFPGSRRDALNYGLAQLFLYPLAADVPPHWDASMRQWNRGGFLPYDDQPEAAYPTVDATWDAVLALSSAYDRYDDLIKSYGSLDVSKDILGAALVDGVSFLLRMQLPSFGWGIYRYRGDAVDVPAHEFTTAQTILALSLCLLTTVFEDQQQEPMRRDVIAALRNAWVFLQDRSVLVGGQTGWVPFFDQTPEDHSSDDLLRATAWTCTGLLALYRRFDDLRPSIAPYLQDIVASASNNWNLDYNRIANVEFRVPLDSRLDDTFKKWSNRYDVTIVILLLDLFNERCTGDTLLPQLNSKLWERIEITLGSIVREQHPEHGHWQEPVAGFPLAAATAMAIQALQLYLIAASHLVGKADGIFSTSEV